MYQYNVKNYKPHGKLTIEKLREFKGFESLLHAEAEEFLTLIETITKLTTTAFQQLKTDQNEN